MPEPRATAGAGEAMWGPVGKPGELVWAWGLEYWDGLGLMQEYLDGVPSCAIEVERKYNK